MIRRCLFFTIGCLYAAVFGFMAAWKAMREAYGYERELKKIVDTPHYRAERKIDEFIRELERR